MRVAEITGTGAEELMSPYATLTVEGGCSRLASDSMVFLPLLAVLYTGLCGEVSVVVEAVGLKRV
jgi:hypothetical protein